METRIQKILNKKGLTQGDLINKIKSETGFIFGRSYISKFCSGHIDNYTIKNAYLLSNSLEVKIDDIVEVEKLEKYIEKTVKNIV
jgi:transcriptional regulator with XRE-family HTH domain